MMTLSEQQFYAADVRRWHASVVPELRDCCDTIKPHQTRCVGLVRRLISDPQNSLIAATRYHDQPEVILGDMPFPSKRDFPALALAWDIAEAAVIKQYNVPQPADQWEADVVKLVDRMDAYMTVQMFADHVLGEPDWVTALNDIEQRAVALGIKDATFNLL